MNHGPSTLYLAAAAVVAAGSFASAQTASIQSLRPMINDLPNSQVGGVSGDGSVVVGNVQCSAWYLNRTTGAVTWPTGMPEPCGLMGGPTLVYGVSRDGSVVVGESAAGGIGAPIDGFRWDVPMALVDLHTCPPSGDPFSPSICPNNGVSADGSVIAGTQGIILFGPPAGEAFRWTAATGRVGLGFLPGSTDGVSQGLDVSDDGQVIVGFAASAGGQRQALYWDAMNAPHLLGAFFDGAGGIAWTTNNDGSVIVGQGDRLTMPPGVNQFPWLEPWIWRTGDEEPTSLGYVVTELPLPTTLPPDLMPSEITGDTSFIEHRPEAVSDDGTIVVGNVFGLRTIVFERDSRGHEHTQEFLYPWIWRQGVGMQLLTDVLTTEHGVDLSGWMLDAGFGEVRGMTPDGSAIVGHGNDLSRADSFTDPYIITFSDCAADLTGDGGVDVFDLLAYLDLWFVGDAAAELTGDDPAAIDVFDLLMYLDSWFAGC